MAKEIEIKVQIENSADLVKFLETEGRFLFEQKQVDEYFSPVHRNFIDKKPVEEWFRVRTEGSKSSLNYKKFDFDNTGRANHSDELEVGVSDPEEMKIILKKLDFKSLVVVDKFRRAWRYKDYEVAFDQVKDLGNFIEIEYKGNEGNPKIITDEMVIFLKTYNCGKISRNFRGYPYMLLFPEDQDSEIL